MTEREWMKYGADIAAAEITVDDRVDTLECFAFRDCPNLEKLTVGRGVRTIDRGVFFGCAKLKEVAVADGNEFFFMDGSCLVEKKTGRLLIGFGSPRIPDCVVSADLGDFMNTGDSAEVYIGRSLKNLTGCRRSFDVTGIEVSPENGNFAATGNCLTDKTGGKLLLAGINSVLPDGVQRICRAAFYRCRALSVKLPASLKAIESDAFSYCHNLKEIIFPEGLEEIGARAFYCCSSLESVRLPSSLKTMGEQAFNSCESLKEIESFGGLKVVPDSAFTFCNSLTELSLTAGIGTVERCAFYGCKELKKVTVCDGVKELKDSVFSNCKALESVYLGDSVQLNGRTPFGDCYALQSVRLPEKLKAIPFGAFRYCKNLKEIRVPESVTKIEDVAFEGCCELTSINTQHLVKVARDAFSDCDKLPKEVKKPVKKPSVKSLLPDELYSYYDFYDLVENCEQGETLEFLRMTLSEVTVVLNDALRYEDNGYIFVTKKDKTFFILVEDEQDEELSEYYHCSVYGEEHRFYPELKAALDAQKRLTRA